MAHSLYETLHPTPPPDVDQLIKEVITKNGLEVITNGNGVV